MVMPIGCFLLFYCKLMISIVMIFEVEHSMFGCLRFCLTYDFLAYSYCLLLYLMCFVVQGMVCQSQYQNKYWCHPIIISVCLAWRLVWRTKCQYALCTTYQFDSGTVGMQQYRPVLQTFIQGDTSQIIHFCACIWNFQFPLSGKTKLQFEYRNNIMLSVDYNIFRMVEV